MIGTNAKRTCANQEKDVVQFLYSDFEKAEIDYPEDISELNKAKRKDPPKPRCQQSKAIDKVKKGIQRRLNDEFDRLVGEKNQLIESLVYQNNPKLLKSFKKRMKNLKRGLNNAPFL